MKYTFKRHPNDVAMIEATCNLYGKEFLAFIVPENMLDADSILTEIDFNGEAVVEIIIK